MKKSLLQIVFICLSVSVLAQVPFDSTSLPIIMIETMGDSIVDNPRILADMKVIYHGKDTFNHKTDTVFYYNNKIGIEIRGSSSGSFPKKGYNIETKLADLSVNDVALFGMPAENDWVLYACYNDKSLIRNALTYTLSNRAGLYAPRMQACELIINRDYKGVYYFMEKIKQGKGRVNIAKLTQLDIAGDDLTGGYIVKTDKQTGNGIAYWTSPYQPGVGLYRQITYQYHYPDSENILPVQRTYIRSFVTSFESVMYGSKYNDSINGYPKYINEKSFLDFILLTELSKNIDAYRLSAFLNKEKDSKGGKLSAGPFWDYDLSFGLADYYAGYLYDGWHINFNSLFYNDGFLLPFWWNKLFNEPRFKTKLVLRWQELRKTVLDSAAINTTIDSLVADVQVPQQRNFTKWPIIGKYVWPDYYIEKSYSDEIAKMKDWTWKRLRWIDKNLTMPVIPPPPPPDTIKDGLTTGMSGFAQVYPNPFTDGITIAIPEHKDRVALRVYDISGTLLFETILSENMKSYFWDGQLSKRIQIVSGFYILKIQMHDQCSIIKLIKE